MLRTALLVGLCILYAASAADLESVSDDDLLNLIKSEKYVVVLFTRKNCEKCDNFETELVHLRGDLVDSFSAWVVKAVNSQLLRLYSTGEEPVLIFFRHGIPLLYDGPLNDDEILGTFLDNKEPVVKELTDETFEHLTQASSGATTGDWFVMFYSSECIECVRMGARWETVGAKLKQSVNVARVNKQTTGAATGARFNVQSVPEFILQVSQYTSVGQCFRHGKMYRYQLQRYDIMSLVLFTKHGYKNARAEIVPAPQTPFDGLVQGIANILHENPWIVKLGSITICVIVIISTASKYRYRSETEQKKD